jgi:O-antigen/teichoic acid export membrane protein
VTVGQLFGYSWKILAATLNDTLFTNLYNLIIGKLFNATVLGYYNRGQSIPLTVMGSVNSTISGVIFPALSHCQEDPSQMRALTRRMITTSSFFVFPAMFGLAAVAEPLVRLILTDKWLPCVPFLQLSCLTYAFWPLHEANLQVLLASGRSDLFLKLEFIKKPLVLLVILLTYRHGVLAMVAGQALLSPLCIFVNAWPNRRIVGYAAWEQIHDILPTIVLSSGMFALLGLLSLIEIPLFMLLFTQIILGVVFYFGAARLFRVEASEYVWGYVRRMQFFKRRNHASGV